MGLSPFSTVSGPLLLGLLVLAWFEPGLSDVTVERNENLIDLSWVYNSKAMQWPKFRSFEMKTVMNGTQNLGGYEVWIQAEEIYMAVHSGTHMDAPCHIGRGKWTIDQIPLEHLVNRPAAVLDVSKKVAKDPEYRISVEDLEHWEEVNGEIPQGAALVLRTGWSQYYGDLLKYMGTRDSDTNKLRYPGLGENAANWLVTKRFLVGIAIEGLSLDSGQSHNLSAHQIVSDRNMFIVENMGPNLNLLPATGAKISFYPMKLEGGSGGPCRVVADISLGFASKSCLMLMGLMFSLFLLLQ
jgi:kynurenine formamidase